MPAPRAVLADILEFNLDHTVAHTITKASGRLAKTAVVEQQDEVVVTANVEVVAAPEPLEVEVKQEEKTEAQLEPTPVEVVADVPQLEEQPVVDEVVTEETPLDSSSKKTKKTKKEVPVS